MLEKRSTVHLRPAALIAVMFLSAMAVTVLAGSGMGAVHANCSLCSFTPVTGAPNAAGVVAPSSLCTACGTIPTASTATVCAETPSDAAAWKVLDLPPPTR
ncbi:MAG: hypothetical protein K8R92_09360 [Planctomycetes bacterium]|nr:hypothetical protein [Planctomycetota bacterium]